MKKVLFFLAVLVLSACNSGNKFHIHGLVDGGEGEMIYLEYTGLLKTVTIDSTKINAKGEFSFSANRPDYPDFYRLSVDNKQIIFAIDSTETIEINATFDDFGQDYKITGSTNNEDILKLRQSVLKIQQKANEFVRGMNPSKIESLRSEIFNMIETHKAMARPIILKDPKSTAAYFAVYQKVNNTYIFSPYNKEDKPYCAAVATAYQAYMPKYDRTKNIYGLVMDAIKKEREIRNREYLNDVIANSSAGYIDIELPDRNGNNKKLSELEGQVVLIDFSAYQARESVQYTFALRELYNNYHDKGFEIYQVSLDRNQAIWEQSVANIPWVCVRDVNGPNTIYAGTYNISSIPTYFLMNRQGEIIGRDFDLGTLKREIEKNL